MSNRMFRRRDHEVPGLNTASLPDLIFTVLFFFMIVTHMREVQVKVKYQVPQGTELERLTKKSAVSYIYIGKPLLPDGGKGRSRCGNRRPAERQAGRHRRNSGLYRSRTRPYVARRPEENDRKHKG